MYNALKPNNPEELVKDRMAAFEGSKGPECSGKKYDTVRTIGLNLPGVTCPAIPILV
jgi:hypothetical protein